MAPSSKNRKQTRGDRRPGTRHTRAPEPFPILPWIVGGAFAITIIALLVAIKIANTTFLPSPVAGVSCQAGEQLAVHYHAHLTIIYDGTSANVPAQIGIKSKCLYWLHTHDTTGVIHIEAPKSAAGRQFTLGDFFAVWQQPLGPRRVATLSVPSGQSLKVWVDGRSYTRALSGIVLNSHTDVVLEIGPPFVEPPPQFTWPASLPK